MKAVKTILLFLAAIIIVAVGYVLYVVIAYHRLDDTIQLDITPDSASVQPVTTDTVYTITTYNVGFGAYSPDFSFFMDGGRYARAYSADAAKTNISGAANVISTLDADFAFFQEVDTDATRSRHVNEADILTARFDGYASVFALNYDSPYLFYPLREPIGRSVSGIMTLSRFGANDAVRYSLPIEEGLRRFLDLDRCFSVTRVPTSGGLELVLLNVHLSAYTSGVGIGEVQLQQVLTVAESEAAAGNYVIIGGDFNKDLIGDAPARFGLPASDESWAQPINVGLLPDGFTIAQVPDGAALSPTVRGTDGPYVPGETFLSVIDGFIVSPNVEIVRVENIDTAFEFSDHNPVLMQFKLLQ